MKFDLVDLCTYNRRRYILRGMPPFLRHGHMFSIFGVHSCYIVCPRKMRRRKGKGKVR